MNNLRAINMKNRLCLSYAAIIAIVSTASVEADELSTVNGRQIVAIENVCAWPNLTLMPDGTIIAIIHNQPSHGGMEGELECWASEDGETWEKRGNPAPHAPKTIRMNHAAGLAGNGDLIVLCSGWTDEKQPQRPKQKPFRDDILRTWVCRSSDGGRTWSQIREFPARETGWSEHIPFGDIFVADDESLRVSTYQGKFVDETKSTKTGGWRSWQFRSDDDGKTWQKGQIIGPRHNETSLFHAGGTRWLAAARIDAVELFDSEDDGLTWNGPQRVTERNEINAHLARLDDGQLLLSYGNRIKGEYGVLAKLSGDEGKTWTEPIRLAKTLNSDCGYPSSVQRNDGMIVTAWYAQQSEDCDHYHMGVVIWDAATVESGNLVRNPGFEVVLDAAELPAEWAVVGGASDVRGTPELMSDGGHAGNRYVRMVDDGPESSLFYATRRIPARPDGDYSASAWMRTVDDGRPGIYINFYNDQGRRIHHMYSRANGPTDGWVPVDVNGTAPMTAAVVTVSLYSFRGDRGTFDFDDVELHVTGGQEPLSAPRVRPSVHDVVDIGSRRELFVDRFLIDGMHDARLVLSRPQDEGVVLKFDKPWEGLFCGYCTVLKTGHGLRVYYRGRAGLGKDGDDSETTCVAESKDGINWTRPKLGLFEIDGSRDNNAVLKGMSPFSHNFSPWIDRRPGVAPDQRYKALAGLHPDGLALFVSSDGLQWKPLKKHVITSDDFAFDSQACAFWSESEQQYVCYFRTWKNKIRWVSRTTSADCIDWTEPVQISFGDAPPEHLYTNQTHPYFRAPHIYVGTAARFVPGRQVVTEEQAREINVNPKYFKDTSDAVLMTSRGGNVFDRTFLTSFIRPGIGVRNWVSRTNYPALNIVQTSPTEMSVYVNQDYAQPTAHLHRYSMRLDGLASVRAEYSGGELLTRPFTFSGEQLSINFATSAAGSIRVELQTADGTPIPGFTISDCRDQIGNEIERTVTWNSESELSTLAGKPVRLRFVMKDADLYSIRFHAASHVGDSTGKSHNR
jgi:BNR repeat-like domain